MLKCDGTFYKGVFTPNIRLKLGDRLLSYNNIPGYVFAIHPSDDSDEYLIHIKWENGTISVQPEYNLDNISFLEYF